jgi:hypothetical protein
MKEIFVFILTFAFIMFYYWINGGYFIRGAELGLAVGLATLFAVLAASLVPVVGRYKQPKGK